jgi:hypothetical protein
MWVVTGATAKTENDSNASVGTSILVAVLFVANLLSQLDPKHFTLLPIITQVLVCPATTSVQPDITKVGTPTLSVEFKPRLPLSPPPQQYTSPTTVIAQLKYSPPEIFATPLVKTGFPTKTFE